MTAPAGAPLWLVVVGMLLALVGSGGGIGALLLVRSTRRKANVDSDEVYTRIAITLVEPLEHRLASAEQALAAEQERGRQQRAAAEAELDRVRARHREALAEVDDLISAAYRLRLLVQQWHRAIMDPAATIEWLRQLVGPTEPTL